MSCLLFFNFILLLFAITLLLLGITTSRWLVIVDNNTSYISSENSNGIVSSCQRLYRQGNTDKYITVNNETNSINQYIYDDAYVCFNRLLKWYNASMVGPELLVVLALITLALFLGFERLQTLTAYGFSFWSFVAGTSCVFISCILTAVYRIDVEFEFRRYRHESVATLC
ncbi:unnamed protein product [Rotaria sp. Silwood2]|nr:unnamed protein product [Rotaria sp. Silwood2]CAF2574050.1 unnamed protein product [Rotaria sp. Silwood2]CAF2966640.1 unnamed protein product [Rotaria sp. Silwood2]CAF4002367.1 unnamed protein product [Rotaria sp. Silwood2]CAF4552624.1 unnamed protein product [Rotaria sp. Silwood2]